jgi:WD40 repeat protein
MRSTQDARQPYPGLRPFEPDEADLFFGREEHVDALLTRLSASHFVAVVGESGAGKSSLVRAGLLPALEAGFVVEAGADWRVAVLRPGGAPLVSLADAIIAPGVLSAAGGVPQREFALAELRRGPLGLVQLIRDAHLRSSCNTLIVVDQFEEVFRYCREPAQKDQANIFVELLLHASRQRQVPIFVVLTMRSDYVGNCARFRGLPEMLNDNQYLTPRLARDQLAAAIREPARVCGGVVEADLVDELCNAVGDDQDQLPLLQHLLMRLWDEASHQAQAPVETDRRPTPWPRLTSELSSRVGGLRSALDNHAQQIYEWLPADRRGVACAMFKCLTDAQSQRRDVRRDALVSEVAAIAGVSIDSTIAVADQFRAAGRHMLMPPPLVVLNAGSRLDISHESLLRQWSTLRQWASEEGGSAREFAHLSEEAQRERSDQGELLSGRALSRAQDWLKHAKPTTAWAERYAPAGALESTLTFIKKSEAEQRRLETERQLAARRDDDARRARRRSYMLGSVAVAVSAFAMSTFTLWQRAEDERGKADSQRQIADTQRHDAEEKRKDADAYSKMAEEQANRARDNALEATRQKALVEEKNAIAEAQRQVAEVERTRAKQEADRAATQAKRADENAARAGRLALQMDVARAQAQTRQLTVSATLALARDAALSMLLARAAVNEDPTDPRAVQALREAIDAHVPNVQANFEAARFRNYIPGSNKNGWLDFSLTSTSLSPIDDLAITPSGKDAVLWSTSSGIVINRLEGHDGVVGSAIFSPDGHQAVTTGSDKTVRIFEVESGKPLQVLTHGAMVNSAAFNPAGTQLVTLADDANAKVWTVGDYSHPRCDIRLPGEQVNFTIATFSHDQRLLATVTHHNRTLRGHVWNVAADGCPRIPVPALENVDIRWVSFSPYGPFLAFVTIEGDVILLDADTWKERRRLTPAVPMVADREGVPQPIAWSTDGRYIAYAGGDNALYIAAIANADHPIPLRGHGGRITSIGFAPGDASLLTTSNDKTARVWTLSPDKRVIERVVLKGHTEAVGSGVFSPRGDAIVTAGDDGAVRSWKPLPVLREWRRANVQSVAFSPDGGKIWAAGVSLVRKESRTVADRLWVSALTSATLSQHDEALDIPTLEPVFLGGRILERKNAGGLTVRELHAPGQARELAGSADSGLGSVSGVSPAGRYAFAKVDRAMLVWDLNEPQQRPELATAPPAAVERPCRLLAVSDDKELAWYCAEDNLVMLWRTGKSEPDVIRVDGAAKVEAVRFSTQGRLVALALDDYSVRVSDVSDVATVKPRSMTGHSGRIRSLDFSRDGRYLVSAGDDNTARVWDVSTGGQAAIVNVAERTRLAGATFSPDGLSVLLLASDRVVMWRCYACGDVDVLLDEMQRRNIQRKLSETEVSEYGLTTLDLAPQPAADRPMRSRRDR